MSPELSKVLERLEFQGMPVSALTSSERSLYRRYRFRMTTVLALIVTFWYVVGAGPLGWVIVAGVSPDAGAVAVAVWPW